MKKDFCFLKNKVQVASEILMALAPYLSTWENHELHLYYARRLASRHSSKWLRSFLRNIYNNQSV